MSKIWKSIKLEYRLSVIGAMSIVFISFMGGINMFERGGDGVGSSWLVLFIVAAFGYTIGYIARDIEEDK